jgi:hypothetical protein
MSDAAATPEIPTVILDLKKQKAKKIKALRKGRGALARDVENAIEDLRREGVIDANAQPVIVIVERKTKDMWKGMKLPYMR